MPSEILSTIELTASAALVVAALSFSLATTAWRRILLAALLAVWFVIVVALGATLALDYVGTPGLGVATALPVAAICFAFFMAPPIRAALFAIPLPVLVAVNAARILGVSFILLYAAHRLPAPFALSAGWGDIFVGLTALPMAWLVARYGARVRGLTLAWNVIGLVDLIAAIGFGATSSPGPIQIFKVSPDTSLMTTLPWILIPCFLVPCYLSLHVAIFYRLSRTSPSALASGDRPASASPAPGWTSTAKPASGVQSFSPFNALYRALEHMSA
ncbi:hypothetical protein [Methylocapsa sp. S129]|uniref:hypothetical protein n=1 Tax=Methylocapsa sp. S129 TaxID=1641869 RepID=UPI001AEE397B|nr:hypothetical protein [Methylocapsa sp. S129]